jgi:hypothetical protein
VARALARAAAPRRRFERRPGAPDGILEQPLQQLLAEQHEREEGDARGRRHAPFQAHGQAHDERERQHDGPAREIGDVLQEHVVAGPARVRPDREPPISARQVRPPQTSDAGSASSLRRTFADQARHSGRPAWKATTSSGRRAGGPAPAASRRPDEGEGASAAAYASRRTSSTAASTSAAAA